MQTTYTKKYLDIGILWPEGSSSTSTEFAFCSPSFKEESWRSQNLKFWKADLLTLDPFLSLSVCPVVPTPSPSCKSRLLHHTCGTARAILKCAMTGKSQNSSLQGTNVSKNCEAFQLLIHHLWPGLFEEEFCKPFPGISLWPVLARQKTLPARSFQVQI